MAQTYAATESISPATARVPYLEWGPIIAGAFGAAAISFLLLTFGAAIGLTMTSAQPNAGASAVVVALVVGWWAIMVQIGSFYAGGYLAGRMRSRWGESVAEEGQFRDGTHGFLVWAVGVVVGALLLAMTGGAVLKTGTQATATVAAGAASGSQNTLAVAPVDYATDMLLRSDRPAGAASASPSPTGFSTPVAAPSAPAATDTALRNEIARIFAASIKNREFTARDRDYLTRLVMARTGLPEADAQKRVDESVTEAQNLEIKAREQAEKARKAALVAGFLAAASLLISLGAACFGAGLGGRHRDEGVAPHFFGHRVW